MNTHAPERELRWEIGIPLLTNPTMLIAMLEVTLGSALLVAALVSLLLGVQGDWQLVPSILGLFAAMGLGFALLSLIVMAVFFGNRFDTRFTVDGTGIHCASVDRRGRMASRAALILGLLTGRPGAAGTGLLSMSQEAQTLAWGGAFIARVHPATRTISLSNRWRTLMTVYCTADNFEAVCARIDQAMTAHGTARRAVAGRSQLGRWVWRSALAVLASLPLFALGDVYGYGLLMPLLLMAFSIAIVWFVRPLAWVVLGLAVALTLQIAIGASTVRDSSFRAGQRYHRYELLSGDDWALTALAALGLAWLCWSALQVLQRRIVPALESDLADGGAE